jgi:hypothetical protein
MALCRTMETLIVQVHAYILCVFNAKGYIHTLCREQNQNSCIPMLYKVRQVTAWLHLMSIKPTASALDRLRLNLHLNNGASVWLLHSGLVFAAGIFVWLEICWLVHKLYVTWRGGYSPGWERKSRKAVHCTYSMKYRQHSCSISHSLICWFRLVVR